MKRCANSIRFRSVLWSSMALASLLGGCGDLTEGNSTQPIGALSLLSSSDDALMPIESTVQRSRSPAPDRSAR